MNEATLALEEIRRTELEAAQHAEDARSRANEIEVEARAQIRRIVEEGRERGRHSARRRLEAAIEEAEAQAAEIGLRGEAEVGKLRESASEPIKVLIEEMVRVVLEPPSEPGK
jgi:vacuolar-type H+-ATPase subunit H